MKKNRGKKKELFVTDDFSNVILDPTTFDNKDWILPSKTKDLCFMRIEFLICKEGIGVNKNTSQQLYQNYTHSSSKIVGFPQDEFNPGDTTESPTRSYAGSYGPGQLALL
ncbi:hypothetical protein STEG23_012630 [Scotinomys teguina]